MEQQLKLHADALQAKLEEMEKTNGAGSQGVQTCETEEVRRQRSTSTLDLLSKEDGPTQSHRRVFSLEKDVSELKGDSKAWKLYELAEAKHRALLRLEKECTALRLVYDRRVGELEHFKQDYEKVLRELQVYRVKKAQEATVRQKTDEKALERLKTARKSPERAALTDRQIRKSSDVERKSEVFKHSDSYSSRSKLDSTPQPNKVEALRPKTHARTVSENVKRPVTSVKTRPKV